MYGLSITLDILLNCEKIFTSAMRNNNNNDL